MVDKKTELKSDVKDTDSANNSDSESNGYSLGERQKRVTDSYRTSWDRIFGKTYKRKRSVS